ncbi:hypothetical protein ARSEF4850_007485 [Beauveria asiatica]
MIPFSSPSPSGGGDSSIGSPDTRLTAPSPNDAIKRDMSSIRSNSEIGDDGPHSDKQMVHRRPDEQREREKDPFVTPGRASKSGLSPTASAFSPFHILTDSLTYPEIHVPVNMLSQSMGLSRWLKIIAERPVTPQEVNGWLQDLEKGPRVFHGARRILERNGTVGIFFEDIRDAWLFHNQTSSSNVDWQVTHDASTDLYPLPRESGQLVVLATVPLGSTASAEQVVTEVMTNLRAHGEIFAFEKKTTYRDGSFRGIVEYCDVVAAKTALTQAPTSEGQSIMLRNIPNKVDQAMLKRIVDESSWGKYDFMYLRIDFANDCNVGYAFINFVDLYFTSNGPMPEIAGQEEQFPEPDNQSKMKRSCENAEHVGLFTPNAGQHFRDEQRRRRSQYDRGTRLAALEEYDLEAIQHLYIGSERPE